MTAGVSHGTQATYKQHMVQHGPCQDARQQTQAHEFPSETVFVIHTQRHAKSDATNSENKRKLQTAFLAYPVHTALAAGLSVQTHLPQLDASLVCLHVWLSNAKPLKLHNSTKLRLPRVPGDIQLVFVPHQDGFVAVLRVPHAPTPAQVSVGGGRLQFLLLLLPDEQRGVPVPQPGVALGQGFFRQGHPPVHYFVSHLLRGSFKDNTSFPAAPKYTPLGRSRSTAAALSSRENIPSGTALRTHELLVDVSTTQEREQGHARPKITAGSLALLK